MKKLTTTRRMGCIPMKTKRRKSPEALFGKVWVVKQSRLMARPLRNELLPACPRPAPIEKIGFFGALGVLTEVAVGTIIADRPPHRSARALISACGSYLG
jgi:hypothetical protein